MDEAGRRIELALRSSFGAESQLNVRKDPYGGWRIQIVSDAFTHLDPFARRDSVLAVVSDDEIAHLELLSPAEARLFSVDLNGQGQGNAEAELPLWPESLARGQDEEILVNLPSRSGELLSAPVVATFYSLRGGVGRSTALAHVAHLLSRKHRVVCMDMDLEAPGLASLFDVEDQVRNDSGIVSILLETEMAAEMPDVSTHLIKVGGGDLYLLPAGLPTPNYARKLGQLDPSAWYREESNPLRALIDAVANLEIDPQVILIDSRTGISPLSAPLLFDVADVAVINFFPHPQARAGTQALTRALLAARTRRDRGEALTPEPRFVISPVPAGTDVRAFYEDRSIHWISEWLAPARDKSGSKPFEDIAEMLHSVGYSEEVAGSDSVVSGDTNSSYAPIAGWIAGFVGSRDEEGDEAKGGISPPIKSEVLRDLEFPSGTAEAQPDHIFDRTFLRTELIARALEPNIPLVLGRKGTGKTAVFRRLAARDDSVVVTSPPGLSTHAHWMPESETYAALERATSHLESAWRSVWPCLIGVALTHARPDLPRPPWTSPLNVETLDVSNYTNSFLVQDVRELLADPESPLHVWDWIRAIDRRLERKTLLLFDGLDTGFGRDHGDLRRRHDGVSGLLAFFMSRSDQLENLRFKILLREDIWRDVSVANKSHLYGRQVRLAWADQTDYLRVAIKQAVLIPSFASLVQQRLDWPGFDFGATDVAYWPEAMVYDVWTLLVGERVSGGKTAFTYNWVWNRLSDANEDHSPRALLQLFNEALGLERRLHDSNPYSRSVLRPRALVESLDEVSEQAIEALREEFTELDAMFSMLSRIGKTPFQSSDLSVKQSVETLAREVGLLGVDVGTRDDVERYRVPELYRKALGMTRRGQA